MTYPRLLQVQPVVTAPSQPLRVALIGAGNRSQTIYLPILRSTQPWVQVVAVCDPVREHADALAAKLGVPAYYDIRALVKARPMEAAIVVVPVDAHHAISVYLSTHGIHNLTETSWASMVCQAQEMISAARKQNVIARVAENFFRFPIDRFAQAIKQSEYLGRVGRIVSYADHTGYHNNSRWIVFAQAHPQWVQCIEHTMAHPAFYSMPQRRHTQEMLNLRVFGFPDDFLVMDSGSGHVKGHLGRHPRPGYTEWHGERGTLVYRAAGHAWARNDGLQAELRFCSEEQFEAQQLAKEQLSGGGIADVITPVDTESSDQQWLRTYANTPQGCIEYINPLRMLDHIEHPNSWYGPAIMGHVIAFALEVRGMQKNEFTDEDALMSQMMEVGAHESALHRGMRVELPLKGPLEADALIRETLRQRHGVDPMDVEAMLTISYARP